ncbi:hypothetical protein BO83DRAFT_382676 [Aspergillus eucalypticola CBS 122712]|uniref:Uncharacterized protein n=1 Tax=Aspergillus eucalypticola (strain CBS 122712 / IBT 29274) TaxID=1448314 RepID=A0A317UN18_ASPEC|nr:uncharacterized protein BO83DRAFT_382676 [Aspergillus eucalypticola CBS 122712]PWY63334.1 hypothetical protein BO83DRAFT_382676 [Aspergillus eucalypticola CBS 122712]
MPWKVQTDVFARELEMQFGTDILRKPSPISAPSYDNWNHPVRAHTREVRRNIYSAEWENSST